jgi:hypothetical protein
LQKLRELYEVADDMLEGLGMNWAKLNLEP